MAALDPPPSGSASALTDLEEAPAERSTGRVYTAVWVIGQRAGSR